MEECAALAASPGKRDEMQSEVRTQMLENANEVQSRLAAHHERVMSSRGEGGTRDSLSHPLANAFRLALLSLFDHHLRGPASETSKPEIDH